MLHLIFHVVASILLTVDRYLLGRVNPSLGWIVHYVENGERLAVMTSAPKNCYHTIDNNMETKGFVGFVVKVKIMILNPIWHGHPSVFEVIFWAHHFSIIDIYGRRFGTNSGIIFTETPYFHKLIFGGLKITHFPNPYDTFLIPRQIELNKDIIILT